MGAMQSVGQLLPTLTGTLGTVQSVLSTVNTVQALANPQGGSEAALDQLREKQALQEQQLASQNALEKQRLATEAAQDEQLRVKALRRAVARQRASFGASGVGGGAGSSEAVLLGLTQESAQDKSDRDALDNLRMQALDQNLAQKKSLNLLQATQLAERQRLSQIY